ncbi:Dynein heavy chain 3, axonemal-like 17, partial [Homarus americanus]
VTDKLQALNDEFTKKQKEKKDLEDSIVRCEQKRDRSERLIGGLGGERDRWSNEAQQLSESLENIVGDVLIAAAIVAYLGAFTVDYRECQELGISCSVKFVLYDTLGDPVQSCTWQLAGLPFDTFSVDNAIIVAHSRRWPLMIDLQGQANKWVVNMEKENGLRVVRQTDQSFTRVLEEALQKGLPLLIEGVGEELDPILDPVLLRQTFKQQGVDHVRVGEVVTEYHNNFRLYITTRLRNPHFLPQVTVKVVVLNFLITKMGLENQLLGLVVAHERPQLEERKNRLLVESAHNRRALQKTQEKILEVLSQEISAKEEVVQQTEQEIDAARGAYKPVAIHASVLFFCSIRSSDTSDDVNSRILLLNFYLTRAIFLSVTRSLFERDKILFSFMLYVRLQQAQGRVKEDVWRFLLTGGKGVLDNLHGAPPAPWLSEKAWTLLVQAADCESLSGVHEHLANNVEAWEEVYISAAPYLANFPQPFHQLHGLDRLALVKCIRPDKVTLAIHFDISSSYDDSTCSTPLIFILSPSTDPVAALRRFAIEKEMGEEDVQVISLGQGQVSD